MKKNTLKTLIIVAFSTVIFISWSKSSDAVTPADAVAFQHSTTEPWFDSNCARCHS